MAITPAAVASIELEQPPIDRNPRGARSEQVVATEKFVGALAYQHDLDAALATLSVQQPCGNRPPVGEQIIEARDCALKIVAHLPRSNQDLLMVRADVPSNVAGVGTLVEI